MIRGSENRRRAVAQARRILKPGGRFVLHVHNFWYNLRDPGGPWWVFKSLLRSVVVRDYEPGDKFFDYRQIPNMYLHVFRRREVCSLLQRAGFRVVEMIRLDPQRFRALRRPWFFGNLRANGWIVVCE